MAEKLTRMVTPRGVASYPHLNAPDTKFNPEGKYKVTLIMQPAEAHELIEKLKPEFAKAKGMIPEKAMKAKQKPTRHEPWEEQEDGTFHFKFSMTASGVSKKTQKAWTRKLPLFDAKGKLLAEGIRIGSGSDLKLAIEVYPYFNAADKKYGVALWMTAVQVIELKTFEAQSADAFGFEEEDGFDASDVDEDSFPSDDAEDEGEEPEDIDESDEDDDEDF